MLKDVLVGEGGHLSREGHDSEGVAESSMVEKRCESSSGCRGDKAVRQGWE